MLFSSRFRVMTRIRLFTQWLCTRMYAIFRCRGHSPQNETSFLFHQIEEWRWYYRTAKLRRTKVWLVNCFSRAAAASGKVGFIARLHSTLCVCVCVCTRLKVPACIALIAFHARCSGTCEVNDAARCRNCRYGSCASLLTSPPDQQCGIPFVCLTRLHRCGGRTALMMPSEAPPTCHPDSAPYRPHPCRSAWSGAIRASKGTYVVAHCRC